MSQRTLMVGYRPLRAYGPRMQREWRAHSFFLVIGFGREAEPVGPSNQFYWRTDTLVQCRVRESPALRHPREYQWL